MKLLPWLLLSFQLAGTFTEIPLKGFKNEGLRDSTSNWVVLHSDESSFVGTTLSFLKRSHRSYNYYITREGKVFQMVDPSLKSNHAGWSIYKGKSHWNEFSIGICLQNNKKQSYTDIQYKQLTFLLLKLRRRYPDITDGHTVRHSDIAWFRGKRDPGKSFNMKRITLDNPSRIH